MNANNMGQGVVAILMACILLSPVWLLVCLFGITKIEKSLEEIKRGLETRKGDK